MTEDYPKTTPFKDSANLVDLPEVSTGRRRNDSLLPGIPDKYLYIGGILLSTVIAGAALSQTPAAQNLIKRVTGRAGGNNTNNQQEEQEGDPIQVPQQHIHQQSQNQGIRVISQDSERQQAEAAAIARQIASQEQARQLALQQADTPGVVDASLYDRIVGGKDSNSIKAYRINTNRRNYSSPFGASFSSS